MQLSTLISELQDILEEEGDLEVMTSSDYGDYSHTEQLNDIEEINECYPEESAYSRSGLAFPSGDEDDDEEENYDKNGNKEKVIVLRYTRR